MQPLVSIETMLVLVYVVVAVVGAGRANFGCRYRVNSTRAERHRSRTSYNHRGILYQVIEEWPVRFYRAVTNNIIVVKKKIPILFNTLHVLFCYIPQMSDLLKPARYQHQQLFIVQCSVFTDATSASFCLIIIFVKSRGALLCVFRLL